MRLENKVCIVTGIGAGIGEAIAVRFAEEGAKLVLNDLNPEEGERVKRLVQAKGASAVFVAGDISKEETGKNLAAAALQAFGAIHVLVNNAADFTAKNVEDAEVTDWQRVLNVNVIGTALVSKAAIPSLKKQGGSIVNVASMSGIIAQRDFSTYSASKGAIIMLTRTMALDLAPYNVRVNSVCPGCIFTSASVREIARLGTTVEEWSNRVAPMHMLNRLGEPIEVANATLFLASDESSFITAEQLMVDGGYIHW